VKSFPGRRILGNPEDKIVGLSNVHIQVHSGAGRNSQVKYMAYIVRAG